MRLSSIVACALLFVAALSSGAFADNPFARTISFSDGSIITSFDWYDAESVLLYAVNPHGSILWKHNIRTGSRSKIITATQLSNLFPKNTDIANLRLSVSPMHKYLLFYERYSDPEVRPFFEVIDITERVPRLVEFENIPSGFWVNEFAWAPDDQYLYVSSVPYLFPEENTSIGRLSLNTESFVGLVVKDNADLIDEIVYSSKLNALIINCWSFHGEYPDKHYILKYDFYSNELSILGLFPYIHEIYITDAGENIYFSLVIRDTNGDGFLDLLDESNISTFNLEKKENMDLLRYSGYELSPTLTPDRKWLGYLRIPERIGQVPDFDDPKELWIMRLDDRREVFVEGDCEGYLFSRDSRKILALSADFTRLEVFDLPD